MALQSVAQRENTITAGLADIREGIAAINQQLSSFSALQRLAKRLEAEENIESQYALWRRMLGKAQMQNSDPIEEEEAPTDIMEVNDFIVTTESMEDVRQKEIMSPPEIQVKKWKLEDEEKVDQLPQKAVVPLFDDEHKRNWGLWVDPCLKIGNYSEIGQPPAMRYGVEAKILKWYRWERDKNRLLIWVPMDCMVLEKFSYATRKTQKAENWWRKEAAVMQKNSGGRRPREMGQYVSNFRERAYGDFECVISNAHQVFDRMPLETKLLKDRRHKLFSKNWCFKFKARIEKRNLQADFEYVMDSSSYKLVYYFRLLTLRTRLILKAGVVIDEKYWKLVVSQEEQVISKAGGIMVVGLYIACVLCLLDTQGWSINQVELKWFKDWCFKFKQNTRHRDTLGFGVRVMLSGVLETKVSSIGSQAVHRNYCWVQKAWHYNEQESKNSDYLVWQHGKNKAEKVQAISGIMLGSWMSNRHHSLWAAFVCTLEDSKRAIMVGLMRRRRREETRHERVTLKSIEVEVFFPQAISHISNNSGYLGDDISAISVHKLMSEQLNLTKDEILNAKEGKAKIEEDNTLPISVSIITLVFKYLSELLILVPRDGGSLMTILDTSWKRMIKLLQMDKQSLTSQVDVGEIILKLMLVINESLRIVVEGVPCLVKEDISSIEASMASLPMKLCLIKAIEIVERIRSQTLEHQEALTMLWVSVFRVSLSQHTHGKLLKLEVGGCKGGYEGITTIGKCCTKSLRGHSQRKQGRYPKDWKFKFKDMNSSWDCIGSTSTHSLPQP